MNQDVKHWSMYPHLKNCDNYSHALRNIYPYHYINMLETSPQLSPGFISIHVINQVDKKPIAGATITVYVTDGTNRAIPILLLLTNLNPIKFELPMASDLGTQIVGPIYNFSTYNLRVDAFGYFSTNVFNIRLFPNITTDFDIVMTPITQIVPSPPIEKRIDIPPNPIDVAKK